MKLRHSLFSLLAFLLLSACTDGQSLSSDAESEFETTTEAEVATTEQTTEGTWAGRAEPTSGMTSCKGADVSLRITGETLQGIIRTDRGEVMILNGTLDAKGMITAGVAMNGNNTANFTGQASAETVSGIWVDVYGCTGSFSLERSPADSRMRLLPEGSTESSVRFDAETEVSGNAGVNTGLTERERALDERALELEDRAESIGDAMEEKALDDAEKALDRVENNLDRLE